MKRVFFILVLSLLSFSVAAQESTACSGEAMDSFVTYFQGQLSDINDAADFSDFHGQITLADAVCNGLLFSGDEAGALPTVRLQDGYYIAHFSSEGEAELHMQKRTGKCWETASGVILSIDGEAESTALFSQNCRLTLNVTSATGPWKLLLQYVPTPTGFLTTTALQYAIEVGIGSGYSHDFWAVYFNEPTGDKNRANYVNGIDVPLANAINSVENTLDIAAFEMNNEVITAAILEAHERGVQVRIVTDDEHGIEDDDSTLIELEEEGIPIVDDSRRGLMHNKFMIMDSTTVWMGSWNYTVNGTYRNDNNALVLQSADAVAAYQAEFNEMFEEKSFGKRSPTGNDAQFMIGDTEIRILFASEDEVTHAILDEINRAESSIRFMAFVLTKDSIGQAIIDRAEAADLRVRGVFEKRGSETTYSELTPLFCAGLDMRQDGNSYVLHHKVFILDDETVITGSFNFSDNAASTNDENLVIIRNRDIASLYLNEFQRVWGNANVPDDLQCD